MPSISIRNGLLAISIATLGLSIGVGYVSVTSTTTLNSGANELFDDVIPGITSAEEMNMSLGDLRVFEAEHVNFSDSAKMEQTTKELTQAKIDFAQWSKKYAATIPADGKDERTLFDDVQAQAKRYFELDQQFIGMSTRNETEAASALYNGEMMEHYDDTGKDLDKLIDMNSDGASEVNDANDATFAQTSTLVMSAVGSLIVLSLLLIGYALLGVARPVARIVGVMNKLAGGDKAIKIPFTGQKTELGAMAGAVQVFKDNMIEADRLRAEQEQARVEQEKARQRAAEERKQSMMTLANQFESTVG